MKKLNVFETFSGIGSQHKALENLTNKKIIDGYNVVGISEWYISAIIAYTLIHYNEEFYKKLSELEKKYENKEKELKTLILKDLEDYTFSTNSKDPCNLNRTNLETLKKLYISMKISKNLGSVVSLQHEEMPKDIDVITYSFPCFTAGHKVLTSKGYKNIEDIKKDEMVLTHKNRYKKVVIPMKKTSNHIYKIQIENIDKIFEVTEEHPFYVLNKNELEKKPEWIEVKNLNLDKHLLLSHNNSEFNLHKILKIEFEKTNVDVYNFEVEDDNSYTIENIIVHNCQDLSNAGLKKGLEVGTRSGLLWEIGRILKVMEESDRPNVLLMENVPTLFNRFKEGWDIWKEELDKLGYDTYQTKLTASNFNVPQMRIRAFGISVKRSGNINQDYLKDFDLDQAILETQTFQDARNDIQTNGRKNIIDILDKNVAEKYYIRKPFNVLKSTDGKTGAKFDLIDHSTYEIANRVYFTNHMSPTLTTSGIIKIYEMEKEIIRQIKEVEAFRLMGFTTEDFEKVKDHFTKGHLYKFAGNSIVVNVLEGLFEVIDKIVKK